ncbi:hypothetical protein EB796_008331 [Bugula neritina]|uniref:Uncharacterized protein n=1 Tax=Bugula neritina TaxID=10212 RepID=A0A7J7K418_BUGNE|nr:hypothetical protein EB796_008331 [Bugula neritina]
MLIYRGNANSIIIKYEVIDDPSKDITTADLSKLTYLECCILEVMRMYSTVLFFSEGNCLKILNLVNLLRMIKMIKAIM